MAIKFACNVCSQTLSVADEHQGKKVRCPKCQTALAVPSGGGPPMAMPIAGEHVQDRPAPMPPMPSQPPPRARREDDYEGRRDYDDRGYDRGGYERGERGGYERGYDDRGYSRPTFQSDERAELQSVAMGLSFHAWRHYMFMTVIFLGVIGFLISLFIELARPMGRRGPDEMFMVLGIGLFILGVIALLLYFIFAFVGHGFCAKTPVRAGAGPLSVTAMIMDICVLVMWLIIVLLGIIAASSRGGDDALAAMALILLVLSGLLFITAEVLFCVYLNRTAHYMGDSRIAGRAIGAMIGWVVTMVGGGLIVLLVGVLIEGNRGGGEGMIILIIFLVAGWLVAWAIMYALIAATCSALKRKIVSEGGLR